MFLDPALNLANGVPEIHWPVNILLGNLALALFQLLVVNISQTLRQIMHPASSLKVSTMEDIELPSLKWELLILFSWKLKLGNDHKILLNLL